jgi:hypothetical protein
MKRDYAGILKCQSLIDFHPKSFNSGFLESAEELVTRVWVTHCNSECSDSVMQQRVFGTAGTQLLGFVSERKNNLCLDRSRRLGGND